MSPRSTVLHWSLCGTGETFQVSSWTSGLCVRKDGSSPELFRSIFRLVLCFSIFIIFTKSNWHFKKRYSNVILLGKYKVEIKWWAIEFWRIIFLHFVYLFAHLFFFSILSHWLSKFTRSPLHTYLLYLKCYYDQIFTSWFFKCIA